MTIQEWAAALRSGKYEQGNQRLRTEDDKYCCLGVLCDLINPAAWKSDRDKVSNWQWEGGYSFLPPDAIYDGIEGLDRTAARQLANANDAGASFEQIADALEALASGGDLITPALAEVLASDGDLITPGYGEES